MPKAKTQAPAPGAQAPLTLANQMARSADRALKARDAIAVEAAARAVERALGEANGDAGCGRKRVRATTKPGRA